MQKIAAGAKHQHHFQVDDVDGKQSISTPTITKQNNFHIIVMKWNMKRKLPATTRGPPVRAFGRPSHTNVLLRRGWEEYTCRSKDSGNIAAPFLEEKARVK